MRISRAATVGAAACTAAAVLLPASAAQAQPPREILIARCPDGSTVTFPRPTPHEFPSGTVLGSGDRFVVFRFKLREVTSDGVLVARENISRRVAAPGTAVQCHIHQFVMENELKLFTGSVSGVVRHRP